MAVAFVALAPTFNPATIAGELVVAPARIDRIATQHRAPAYFAPATIAAPYNPAAMDWQSRGWPLPPRLGYRVVTLPLALAPTFNPATIAGELVVAPARIDRIATQHRAPAYFAPERSPRGQPRRDGLAEPRLAAAATPGLSRRDGGSADREVRRGSAPVRSGTTRLVDAYPDPAVQATLPAGHGGPDRCGAATAPGIRRDLSEPDQAEAVDHHGAAGRVLPIGVPAARRGGAAQLGAAVSGMDRADTRTARGTASLLPVEPRADRVRRARCGQLPGRGAELD